jgi:hypothetical protein
MPSFRSLWALALAPACAPSTHHESQAPVCSTTVPGETALAPELSDSGRIYRGTLSPGGRELWFFKKVTDDPQEEDYRIYRSRRSETGWSAAERVDLGGEFSDLYPFRATTPDWETTTTLVTVWTGSAYAAPVPYEPVERWAGWRPDLYVWGGVPGPRGSVVLEVSALAEDGRRRGPTDLWMAQRGDGGWAEPKPLGGGVNTPGNETFPAVTADGCALVFVRDFSSVHLVTLAAAAPPP